MERIVRLAIGGRVQGVGYRYWTMATAQRLGLRGWVRNRIDGSVEALVAGDSESVGRMIEEGVDVTEAAAEDPPEGFTQQPTV